MLVELQVRDFAIIEHLRLALEPGLNVLTGETGAGKSIVVDALGALMGMRLGPEVVRAGADSALVDGVVSLSAAWLEEHGEALYTTLEEHGLFLDGDTMVLTRELHAEGRSVARIDGRAVPLRALQQVGRLLLDIHGQGEQQSLVRVGLHRDLLDGYAGLAEMRQAVAEQVTMLHSVRREIVHLRQEERDIARRLDLLSFQVNEIEDARLRPGEDAELEQERRVLANAERLAAAAAAAHEALAEGTGERPSALDLVNRAAQALTEAARLDRTLEPTRRTLEEVQYQIKDAAHSLRAYRDSVEADPARLEAVEERLHLITRLRHKYGDTIEEVVAFAERARAERDTLTHREERLAELEQQETALLAEVGHLAGALSDERRTASAQLAAAVQTELAELGMAKARFQVTVEQEEATDGVELPDGRRCRFDASGVDRVQFLIAPNPGEPLLPLAKIASGGELARTMLALKTVLAQADATPALVFDEVDSGVGARGGEVVGRKLWRLSERHQVLCVSHLPQVAAYADAHYRVAKTSGERTTTSVHRLSAPERVEEVAAMLGGSGKSVLTQWTAGELLQRAAEWKNESRAKQEALQGTV